MTARVLSLPGWRDSGPGHWQSAWEALDARIVRVRQQSFDAPTLGAWLSALDTALGEGLPTVLVGHSLGALLGVHAQRLASARHVVGALLVAPPVLEAGLSPEAAASLASFWPPPMTRLPWPSVLVSSADDPFLPPARAAALAAAWGSQLVELGPRGHVNAESGLGHWPQGRELLRALRAAAPFSLDARLEADSTWVADGALCQLRLMNDARYPWCLLVPRVSAVEELTHLTSAQRAQLEAETNAVVEALQVGFPVDKVNVGALGNVVRQLHLHVVGRRLNDAAWPGPVWGHSPRVAMTADQLNERQRQLLAALRPGRFTASIDVP